MKPKCLFILFIASVLFACFSILPSEAGDKPNLFIPDKALCAKMLRFGKQAYERGKYLDAKEYFRKAVQADPGSPVAWRYYDMAVIFGLAEKVEKNAGMTAPDRSVRGETGTAGPLSAPPPPAKAAPAPKKDEFVIEQDEGC